MATGGSGYLGRGILRQVARADLDWEVTVFSRDETKQDECRKRYPFARYVLGDVRDADRLTLAMDGQDVVIHAAALKYVPDAERNASECVSVNIEGSQAVILAAAKAGVKRVVGISSDKGCQPANVYGATKMVMERLFADVQLVRVMQRAEGAFPVFTCVRYGNVVGSTGSVIPLFRQQFAETGQVRITDPRMTRFWMSVDEAIATILLALEAAPGAVVVPMAAAMTLADVARAVAGEDVPLVEIGVRPGEKLHECLVHYEESVRARVHDGWIELLPVGFTDDLPTIEAFTMASHTPSRMLSVVDMKAMIADSEVV